MEAAQLGVMPDADDGLVLLGVEREAADERALVDAARRGDLVEVVRLAADLAGTGTAQAHQKRR